MPLPCHDVLTCAAAVCGRSPCKDPSPRTLGKTVVFQTSHLGEQCGALTVAPASLPALSLPKQCLWDSLDPGLLAASSGDRVSSAFERKESIESWRKKTVTQAAAREERSRLVLYVTCESPYCSHVEPLVPSWWCHFESWLNLGGGVWLGKQVPKGVSLMVISTPPPGSPLPLQ